MIEKSGGCLCGAKRFTARLANHEAALCHCRLCQRASGNVFWAFVTVQALQWEGNEPDYYQSSPIARRGHCAACGTTLTFEYLDEEGVDVSVAAFDDPGAFRPTKHFAAESMLHAWVDTRGLPEYRTQDNPKLVDRWMKSIGKLPD